MDPATCTQDASDFEDSPCEELEERSKRKKKGVAGICHLLNERFHARVAEEEFGVFARGGTIESKFEDGEPSIVFIYTKWNTDCNCD